MFYIASGYKTVFIDLVNVTNRKTQN